MLRADRRRKEVFLGGATADLRVLWRMKHIEAVMMFNVEPPRQHH